ncbi:MAG TPA: serine hydrolase domain-containing protein [Sphingomonas sp.]|jgi:CubicO group peptidase (beta-lactamase class C family)|uniref:serine hydrolase domain-containing protein n=1 Tax=Sphingomonas sp. TaxID=28214 RepID=UPI002ED85452
MTDLLLDRRTLLAGLSTFAPAAALARGPAYPAVNAVLDRFVPARLPGAVVAIGRGFAPPIIIARGRLAVDPAAPAVGGDSLWRIYSMTKPITGIAAMLLIEQGKLGLDQPIADFLPAFGTLRVLANPGKDRTTRPAKAPITVRHLLTHTAGLSYHIDGESPLRDDYIRLGLTPARVGANDPGPATAPSLAAFADRLATVPLLTDPGTAWRYSLGLDLLGRVIEVASGIPFDQFLATRIFVPLGLRDTHFTVPAAALARLATNYGVGKNGLKPLDPGPTSVYAHPAAFPFGGAGLVSSARDYDRFLLMLLGEGAIGRTRILAPATARLAMSNLLPANAILPADFGGPDGGGFGAGGRVSLRGPGAGTFGWAGAAGTIGWVDRRRALRGGVFLNYMPPATLSVNEDLRTAVYRDVAA